jgi:exopolyphosphatase / guanosine-5'-triphosphate,3'-diphosphate pyrophosphatase
VVDVGGGSTELAVGTPLLGAAWVRSADLGSLRLTRSCLHHDPPSRSEVSAARFAVATALDDMRPPAPDLALAVGGSARSIAKITGRRFDADELDRTAKLLARRPAAKAARSFGIGSDRAETLLAGTLLLAGASRVLRTELVLARGGVREGAALALAGAGVGARAA